MRNLKKVLSLSLALVMLLGMMVMGAGAAEFKDGDSIKNTEAVDVVSGIGVLMGDENKNFNPTGTLTRAEAAVVIAKLDLGEAFGNLATTNASTFSDVAANHWAKAYIDYCAARGLIAGDGAGRFMPNDKVSGVQFALMVARVLGYDDKAESVGGAGWEVAAAALARKAGLTVNVTLGSQPITRDDMAQVAFNALKADMVEYKNPGTEINTGTGSIIINGSPATPKSNASVKQYNGNGNTNSTLQLCEEKFPKLTLAKADDDAFGNPQRVWKLGVKDISTVANTDDAIASYENQAVSEKTLYGLLGKDAKAVVYTDGKVTKGSVADNGTVTYNAVANDATQSIAGLGSTVKVYKDGTNDNEYKVVVVNTYSGTISGLVSATSTRKAAVNVAADNSSAAGGKFETEAAFEVGDNVLYTLANNKIQSVTAAETTTGTLTRFVASTSSVVVGGSTYKWSSKANQDPTDVQLKTDVKVVFDAYGNAIALFNAEDVVPNYAVVIDTAGSGFTRFAQMVLADGTIVEAKLSNDSTAALRGDISKPVIVSYTEKDGVYKLTSLVAATTMSGDSGSSPANDKLIVETGKAALTVNDAGITTAGNSTLFFVKTSVDPAPLKVSVYEGIKNVPVLKIKGAGKANEIDVAAYAAGGSSVAKVVFVDANPNKTSNSGASVEESIFIVNNDSKMIHDAEEGNYYVFPAVVDGEYNAEFKVKSNYSTGLYTQVVYDENNIATLSSGDAAGHATETYKAVDGTILVNTTKWTFASDIPVYYVENKDLSAYGIGYIGRDTNDKIWVIGNTTTKVASAIIVQPVDGGTEIAKGDEVEIKADTEASTVSGKVEVEAGKTLTVKDKIEKGAEITISDKAGLALGPNVAADEKVTLAPEGRTGNLSDLPAGVAVVISSDTAVNYTDGSDTDKDTIYVGYTRAKTASDVTLTIKKDDGTEVYKEEWKSVSLSAGRGSIRVCMSAVASSATGENHVITSTLTGNKLENSTHYTLTVVTDVDEGTTVGFTTPATYTAR